MRGLDDSELVERAKAGESSAYDELVRRYQEIAVRTAWLITGSAAEAEDAAQEGFVKAYLALSRFRPGAPFRPWLLQIVANEARNRRKSAGRRFALALRSAQSRTTPEVDPSPELSLIARERDTLVLDAVNQLREEERLVIACRYFLDFSEAETAATLGCPKGTVKSRLSRAVSHLRASLDADLLARDTRTTTEHPVHD